MLRKITSLTLAWMFIVSAISGIMLYIAPPGRIAYWADWSMISLSKGDWDHLHTVMSILILFVVALHLYYNWKAFTSYMKDKVTKALSATKELLISLAIVSVIIVGALTQVPPFGWIVDLGDYVSEEWEVTYGSPPYNHAELDTLKEFCQRLNINLENAKAKLEQHDIVYTEEASLLDIAQSNTTSPQAIYELVVGKAQSEKTPAIEGSGMGNKTLKQLCELRGLDLKVVKQTLKTKGIDVNSNEKFKEIAEANGIHPMELLEIVESTR
jgi:hypothetical protein